MMPQLVIFIRQSLSKTSHRQKAMVFSLLERPTTGRICKEMARTRETGLAIVKTLRFGSVSTSV